MTNAFRARQRQLAESWYQKGQDELRRQNPNAAIFDFRSALLYNRNDERYRLSLAESLLAAGRNPEARVHLQALLESNPANGLINLELGRLAAKERDVPDALRYYHAAVYGEWDQDAELHRRQARLELIDFLLGQNHMTQAEAELIALSGNLPAEGPLLIRVGDLFAKVGDYNRAARFYASALRIDGTNLEALYGLGTAEFALGRYAEAKQRLAEVVAREPGNSQAASMEHIAALVLELDPHGAGASGRRIERVRRAFELAGQRLERCGLLPARDDGTDRSQDAPNRPRSLNPETLSQLRALAENWMRLGARLNPRLLRSDADLREEALDVALSIEQEAATVCGPLGDADRALVLIAQERRP